MSNTLQQLLFAYKRFGILDAEVALQQRQQQAAYQDFNPLPPQPLSEKLISNKFDIIKYSIIKK